MIRRKGRLFNVIDKLDGSRLEQHSSCKKPPVVIRIGLLLGRFQKTNLLDNQSTN